MHLAPRTARPPLRPLSLLLVPAVLLGLAVVGLGAAAVLLEVRTFRVPTGAMIPSIEPGDWIVVGRSKVERGAVVVHEAPEGAPSRDPLLKRVVGVGGDTVEVRDGTLWLNGAVVPGEELAGPCTYWDLRDREWTTNACRLRTETLGDTTYRIACNPGMPCGDVLPMQVPPGTVFVLGDHRDHSQDSRYFGPIAEHAIFGRAFWIAFSAGPDGVRWGRIGTRVR